ncbi:hypothetical protein PNEG_01431 [Pneumocystis murina B123]|uniref:non-specific serine/threonine protein kinase n=1 Tax=Pneumocystis murina (strain B123) TaxID=1069680 RepID=M7NSA9_PNEMU|nr:hypothetical protein PNEG_01431 [Pneumocystis murina B123]EMR10157.1 hypothetical protein PNEG_01431 [Pneumocystis murina B123]
MNEHNMISYHHKERSLSSIFPSIFQKNTSDVIEECHKKPKKESSFFSLESLNSCMKKQYSSKVFNYSKWRETQNWQDVKETNHILKTTNLVSGRKVINKYEIIREIGRGVHGKVKLALDLSSNEYVALKIIERNSRKRLGRNETSSQEQKIRREIAILKKCIHPHVVRLREVMDDPMSRKIYLVLEYMDGGEVIWRTSDDKPALTIWQARSTFRDVVLGLEYLHYQGIIHRDIKPANLLWTKNHVVKISDFGVSYSNTCYGLSAEENELELAKTAGTPAFFAPELCYCDPSKRCTITKAIDIWALGITLYCLLFGSCPFTADGEYELMNVIPTKPLEIPSTPPIGDKAKNLLKRLLEKDPNARITLEEIKRHPWLLEDISDPENWIKETDPRNYQLLEVTQQEVDGAVSIVDKLKRKLTKLTSKFSRLAIITGLKKHNQNISSSKMQSERYKDVGKESSNQNFNNSNVKPSVCITKAKSVPTSAHMKKLIYEQYNNTNLSSSEPSITPYSETNMKFPKMTRSRAYSNLSAQTFPSFSKFENYNTYYIMDDNCLIEKCNVSDE